MNLDTGYFRIEKSENKNGGHHLLNTHVKIKSPLYK
jgi:hypothetical protein